MSPATPTNAAAMREMRAWRRSLTKDQRWCILITADPDALASALALKRIMQTRVRSVDIARTNEVTRPDNLAMIRYLRIPARQWQPEKAASYTHFAIVDSQPSHNPAYYSIKFDVIIDHHPPKPLPPEAAASAAPAEGKNEGKAAGKTAEAKAAPADGKSEGKGAGKTAEAKTAPAESKTARAPEGKPETKPADGKSEGRNAGKTAETKAAPAEGKSVGKTVEAKTVPVESKAAKTPEGKAAEAAPETETPPHTPALVDIRPAFGATSTMMTRYLQGLRISPSPHLATALLYGIRTDTAAFERSGGEDDLRAYQWLSRFADTSILRRIIRSEYLRAWLPLFSRAFRSLRDCRGGGVQAWLNEVDTGDLLVAVADFFTRVHGLKWVAVSGIVDKKVIVIFRGDGSRDIGRLADACFHDVGSAGGHRTLGRAEFPLSAVTPGMKPADFVQHRLMSRKLRPLPAPPPAPPCEAEGDGRDHDRDAHGEP